MARQRRIFSTEFKLDAARQVIEPGYSIPEPSRSLDVGESALRCRRHSSGIGTFASAC